jgi:hypothetical protein
MMRAPHLSGCLNHGSRKTTLRYVAFSLLNTVETAEELPYNIVHHQYALTHPPSSKSLQQITWTQENSPNFHSPHSLPAFSCVFGDSAYYFTTSPTRPRRIDNSDKKGLGRFVGASREAVVPLRAYQLHQLALFYYLTIAEIRE